MGTRQEGLGTDTFPALRGSMAGSLNQIMEASTFDSTHGDSADAQLSAHF